MFKFLRKRNKKEDPILKELNRQTEELKSISDSLCKDRESVEAEIQKADSMFMAVAVPAGEHAVGLYYITPGLKEGVVLTGLGGLALAAQLIWYAARRRKAARMKPAD